MKLRLIVRCACLLLAGATAAHAQGGCVNSPECPTVVLAAVGTLGATIFHRWKR